MRRMRVEEEADWHVFARGVRRLVLFREAQDYEIFLAYLRQGLLLAGCTLWAFTLMSNHYHLALRATSDQLRVCMHHLNRLYSRYHNRKYGLDGHTFDGPYQAYRQGTIFLLLRTIAYVFLNPVTAGMVDRPEDYRWSCFRQYVGLRSPPLPVIPTVLLMETEWDFPTARSRFLAIMEWESARLQRKPPGPITASQIQMQHFEWLLEEARNRGDALLGENPDIVGLYWARLCGVSPRAAAKVLGTERIGALRNQLYRFRKKVEGDPALMTRFRLP